MKEDKVKELFNAFLAFLEDFKEGWKDEVKELLIQEQSKPVSKLFYNLKELEKLTGISYLGLKGRIKRGTLKASKNANKWLVTKDEVQRLIDDLNRKKRA